MSKGVCVQIGIRTSAEYLYLAMEDWRELMAGGEIDPIKRLPEQVCDVDEWDYYGVDCDVESSCVCSRTWKQDNVRWVTAAVSEEAGLERLDTDVRHCITGIGSLNHRFKLPECYVPRITLKDMLDGMGIDQLDALCVDIDGGEVGVFRTYDWSLKPRFVSVEFHHNVHWIDLDMTKDEFVDLFVSKGYALIFEELVHDKQCYELQFLLEER